MASGLVPNTDIIFFIALLLSCGAVHFIYFAVIISRFSTNYKGNIA